MMGKMTLSAAGCVVMVLLMTQGVDSWLCYSQEAGSSTVGYAFCPTKSCFSVGGGVFGYNINHRGCADKLFTTNLCESIDVGMLAEEHFCYCNTYLCNTSVTLKPVFAPLILLLFIFLLR